jgi:hypothetical protein
MEELFWKKNKPEGHCSVSVSRRAELGVVLAGDADDLVNGERLGARRQRRQTAQHTLQRKPLYSIHGTNRLLIQMLSSKPRGG